VSEGKNWGYIDESGTKVVDFIYRDAEVFSEDGLAPVKENKLWGFIDKTGKLIIPMEYDISVSMFGFLQNASEKGFIDGLARVKKKKEWGFINKKGQGIGKWHQNAELFVDTTK